MVGFAVGCSIRCLIAVTKMDNVGEESMFFSHTYRHFVLIETENYRTGNYRNIRRVVT
jgi:hypothetical protein